MRNALLAGTAVAIACGVAGWFVVVRSQVFAGDALGHVAFTGTVAAAAAGFDLRAGLLVATVAAGAALGTLGGRRGRLPDDVAIGTAFAWILGLGLFFLTLASNGTGVLAARTLFGSILGLSGAGARFAALIAMTVTALTLAIARPLLFASVDPALAGVRGVPPRALGIAFLALLGAVAGEATQAVGALLALGLIAAPAGAALQLTSRPYAGVAVAAALAVAATWGGLSLSYAVPGLPPSTAVIALAVGAYALAALARRRTAISSP